MKTKNRKLALALITAILFTFMVAPMTASASGSNADVTVIIEPTLLSVTVSITIDINVNPNSATEAGLISASSIKFKNNTASPVNVTYDTISYLGKDGDTLFDGPKTFCRYSDDALLKADGETVDKIIDWRSIGRTSTHSYVAFGLDKTTTGVWDLLPDKNIDMFSLSSKFNASGIVAETATNVTTLPLRLKAGLAWASTHAGSHRYNIVFIISLTTDNYTDGSFA